MPRPFAKSLLLLNRSLHIYISMFALLLVLFFSVTGVFLNRPEWFDLDQPIPSDREGSVPTHVLETKGDQRPLAMVEYLRANLGARGQMTSFEDEPDLDEIRIQFTGPGRRGEFLINKKDGKTQIHEEVSNSLSVLSDLHKGKGSGGPWKLLIDISAILLVFISLTGIILWVVLPKRRKLGIISLVAGTVVSIAIYWWLVP
jgi:hypothetical protein